MEGHDKVSSSSKVVRSGAGGGAADGAVDLEGGVAAAAEVEGGLEDCRSGEPEGVIEIGTTGRL